MAFFPCRKGRGGLYSGYEWIALEERKGNVSCKFNFHEILGEGKEGVGFWVFLLAFIFVCFIFASFLLHFVGFLFFHFHMLCLFFALRVHGLENGGYNCNTYQGAGFFFFFF